MCSSAMSYSYIKDVYALQPHLGPAAKRSKRKEDTVTFLPTLSAVNIPVNSFWTIFHHCLFLDSASHKTFMAANKAFL